MKHAVGSLRRTAKLVAFAGVAALTPLVCVLGALGAHELAMSGWFRLLGAALWVRSTRRGRAPDGGCLVVSNHVGYLDPIVLGRYLPSRFLAKSEIAGWPVIGALSRVGRVLFLERDRPRSAAKAVAAVARDLSAGHRLVLFPEAGVSPDGVSLAEFRPMLFEACVVSGRPVVPVAVRYRGRGGREPWAWNDGSSLGEHFWTRLLPAAAVRAELRVGEPLWPAAGEGRKELAARTREAVLRLLEGEI